jgi:hypothetical protein
MRTLITTEPFPGPSDAYNERGIWPAHWIGHPQVRGLEPAVTAFRRVFSLAEKTTLRIHVSADERYELFLDGTRIGRGPERGDVQNWFYETHDLDLPAGQHTLVARTWWIGPTAPYAQMSVRPGFLLAAQGPLHEQLTTGVAAWETKRLGGYEFLPVDQRIRWVGAKLAVHGNQLDWGVEKGEGKEWQPAEKVGQAQAAVNSNCTELIWRLRPAILPPMYEKEIHIGAARHVQKIESLETRRLPVRGKENLSDEAAAWNRLLSGQAGVTVPAHTMRRIIVDLGNYYAAFPQLVTSGGAGATIRIHWAESLFEQPKKGEQIARPPVTARDYPVKGNRDEIENKIINGVGDIFEPDGGNKRHFHTLTWEAGRYMEIVVSTAKEPLTIDQFWLIETHYPFSLESRFESSDHRLAEVETMALRTLEAGSHETYTDSPYYEQLMYLGDTRLEVLVTYAACPDDRLPRKAVLMFDVSRRPDGLTQSRYPSHIMQIIPPFSLWWVAMVHDYAMWRDDRQFVADRMPGVRAVLDAFRKRQNRDGLLDCPEGWNFIDWVPGWRNGVPPDGYTVGVSAPVNFQFAWVMRQAAELEEAMGEPEMAARNRRHADELGKAAAAAFWDERRGILADDLTHKHFSEHSQCLALLGGCVPKSQRERLVHGLLNESDLSQATIYFMHYLFETYRMLGLPQRILDRMSLWFELKAEGLRTTVESPEPCRSDCHAWGAHPVFHYYATILGIRPAEMGFGKVRIEPQLGPLTWAKGTLVHPKGRIHADFAMRDGKLAGEIELPAGVSGTLVLQGKSRDLRPGKQKI